MLICSCSSRVQDSLFCCFPPCDGPVELVVPLNVRSVLSIPRQEAEVGHPLVSLLGLSPGALPCQEGARCVPRLGYARAARNPAKNVRSHPVPLPLMWSRCVNREQELSSVSNSTTGVAQALVCFEGGSEICTRYQFATRPRSKDCYQNRKSLTTWDRFNCEIALPQIYPHGCFDGWNWPCYKSPINPFLIDHLV